MVATGSMTQPPIAATSIPAPMGKTIYPEPYAALLQGRLKRKLGEYFGLTHQILRYVWKPPSFMRGRKNELAALAAFILTGDRIEGWNKP
jgi:hypothetical protein